MQHLSRTIGVTAYSMIPQTSKQHIRVGTLKNYNNGPLRGDESRPDIWFGIVYEKALPPGRISTGANGENEGVYWDFACDDLECK